MAFTAENGVTDKGERYDRSFLVKSDDKLYKRTEFNDFIYSSNNLDVGSIGLNKFGTAVISDVYEIFKVNDKAMPDFVSELIQRPYTLSRILRYRQGCLYGQYKIYADDFLSVDVFAPSLDEQRKINNFLTAIDARIEKQRQLVEALKKYKRGVKSCIFSQHSSWNRDTADKLAHIATGSSNTQDSVADGKFPFFIRSANVARSNKYIFDGEAVLTIGDGQIGKVFHYINGKFDCHQRVYMITDFRKISGRYFYHFFSTFFYERAMKMSAKNTVDSVRMEMIAKMPIYYPSQEQQNKIVSLLDALDTKIMDEHQEQEKLELVKKGLLQQMFI